MRTFIVAPLTTGGHPCPFRVACKFQGRSRAVVPDQSLGILQEMFSF